MSETVSNVNVATESFQNWIDKTNILLGALSTRILTVAANSIGGLTTGNAAANGIFAANTLAAVDGLRGGNVTTSATLTITSNLTVSQNTTLTGAVSLGNTLSVTGASQTGNVSITGFINVSSTANVGGATTLRGTLTVNGAVVIANTLSVSQNVAFTGNDTHTIAGNVDFDTGTLFVDATNNRIKVKAVIVNTGIMTLQQTDALPGVTHVSTSNTNIGSNITAPQLIYSFPKTSYAAGEVTVVAANTTVRQIEKILFTQDAGTNVHTTVYGRVATPSSGNVGIANVIINNANVEINFQQGAANSIVNIVAQLFSTS